MSRNITTDDKALNGEETVDSEPLANEEEETGINSCYYDKSKSFFDNLSCDDARYLMSSISKESKSALIQEYVNGWTALSLTVALLQKRQKVFCVRRLTRKHVSAQQTWSRIFL